MRTAHQTVPHLEEMGSCYSLALLGQQCRLLWEGHDLERGSSLPLRQALKEPTAGGHLLPPLPACGQRKSFLVGECGWHICDHLSDPVPVGLSSCWLEDTLLLATFLSLPHFPTLLYLPNKLLSPKSLS